MVDIAEKVGPAVVSIETNSLLNKGTGSGIVISADGLILTNAHVVYGASNVSVELNKQTYKGVVKYVDAITDLALIKIEIVRWYRWEIIINYCNSYFFLSVKFTSFKVGG